MDHEQERYFDFSTDDRDLSAFSPGYDTHPDLAQYAEEIQEYVGFRNPIVSIRGLLALHAATMASVAIGARQSRKRTNILLSVIVALLSYIAYSIS